MPLPLPPPFFIILNTGSGRDDKATTQACIEGILSSAQHPYTLTIVEDPKTLATIARRTVDLASSCGGVVVAAGGDGTISTVAQAVHGSACSFGVLPQGTFNYFVRQHGIPSDTALATRLLLTAKPHPVQVGLINERLFLVNASLGLYPLLLEDREAWKAQLGRSRLVALAAGLVSLFRHRRQLHISLEQPAQRHQKIRTPTLFVSNNSLQLQQLGLPLANSIDNGQLAAVALRPVGNLAILWLLLRGAFGQLGSENTVVSYSFRKMTVRRLNLFRGHSRSVKVAIDGEVTRLKEPLKFRVSPKPLMLLKPDSHAADATVFSE